MPTYLFFGLLIPAFLIAGVTFLCQSVPAQRGCFPKWNSEANTQSAEAEKGEARFQASSAFSARTGIGRGRRENSVLVGPTIPSTQEHRTCKIAETGDEVLDALIAIERAEVSSVRFGSTPLVDQGLVRTFCDLHKEILPVCSVRPTHGDAMHLAEEVLSGTVDAAFVTLPCAIPICASKNCVGIVSSSACAVTIR